MPGIEVRLISLDEDLVGVEPDVPLGDFDALRVHRVGDPSDQSLGFSVTDGQVWNLVVEGDHLRTVRVTT